MAKRDRKKRKRGPTPRRQRPAGDTLQWTARCDECGVLQVLHVEPSTDDELLMSPCGHCGCLTATYFEWLRPQAA